MHNINKNVYKMSETNKLGIIVIYNVFSLLISGKLYL